MRLTLSLLGWTFDVNFSQDQDAPVEDDRSRDLSGGYTSSYPVGFVASPGDQRWESGGQP